MWSSLATTRLDSLPVSTRASSRSSVSCSSGAASPGHPVSSSSATCDDHESLLGPSKISILPHVMLLVSV